MKTCSYRVWPGHTIVTNINPFFPPGYIELQIPEWSESLEEGTDWDELEIIAETLRSEISNLKADELLHDYNFYAAFWIVTGIFLFYYDPFYNPLQIPQWAASLHIKRVIVWGNDMVMVFDKGGAADARISGSI